jgi:hypothetical protein
MYYSYYPAYLYLDNIVIYVNNYTLLLYMVITNLEFIYIVNLDIAIHFPK